MQPLPGFNENVHPFFRAINAIQRVREDDTPCEIEKGLYLGSLRAANNKSALISYNVTHILTVAGHLPPSYSRDFVYKCITISDREYENISQYFDECFNFIEEAKRRGGGVLVHCFAGRSRSVSIVVAYLMKKHGMSLQQAMEHVRSKRPVASPNSGFMSQLRVFEVNLRGSENEKAEDIMTHKMTKKKKVNHATAPTDVWVDVGRKKTGDSTSEVAHEANATAEALVAVPEVFPPIETDRVMTQEEEEAALDETTDYEDSNDDCDDDDVCDDVGEVWEDYSDDPCDKEEEGNLVMAL